MGTDDGPTTDPNGREANLRRREVLPTGVVGLDEVLDGGLRPGDFYLVAGPPGSGKTTLGNQVAYARAAEGAVAIYATVLAETHERMLTHLAGFSFFDLAQVARRVHYVSLYDELGAEGLSGALALLRRLVREHRASILVVDGASLFDDFAESPVEFRRFTSELHAQLATLGCTTLLLADEAEVGPSMIGFGVDGVISLDDETAGMRDVRLLRVSKLRGADPLRGRHHFAITRDGLVVYPRIEATLGQGQPLPEETTGRDLQGFGVPGLDRLIGGGLPPASTTLLLGVPGTGKTCTGLHFVAEGARRGERGVIATLDETPTQLLDKAAAIGIDLAAQVEAGDVRILWNLPLELPLDAWALELLAAVDDLGARRVFVDPAGAFPEMAVFAERLPSFLAALVFALRQRGVGAVFSAEMRTVVGDRFEVPPTSFPVAVDNAIVLRYVELRSRLRRLISVLKVRAGAHDTSLREFSIGPRGIEVAESFAGAEAVLSGIPRLVPTELEQNAPAKGEGG